MDLIKLHKKAGEEAAKFIEAVKDDQWDKQSDCSDWTVRDLVNHIVSENLWVEDLMEGKTIEEVGDKYEGDVLGENPLASYERSITAANEAIDTPGSMDKIVHLSYGDIKASVYIGHRLTDLVIHSWDVAKSTGQSDELDPELVKALEEILKPQMKEMQGSGYFGTPVEVSEDAPLQDKLLGWLGRER
jgi:uncharacterized protein (TIGR03086 family)